MPTIWKEADRGADRDTGVIEHLAKHGVFDEVERLFADPDQGETLTPEQVRERLARFPG